MYSLENEIARKYCRRENTEELRQEWDKVLEEMEKKGYFDDIEKKDNALAVFEKDRDNRMLVRKIYFAVEIYHQSLSNYLSSKGIDLPDLDTLIKDYSK